MPVGDRKWPLSSPVKLSGFVITFVPPAMAVSQSFLHSELQAMWMAAALDEQAVSTLTLGPENLKW